MKSELTSVVNPDLSSESVAEKKAARVRNELERMLGNIGKLKNGHSALSQEMEKREDKEAVIARLREVIANAEKTLEENKARRERNRAERAELVARLTELEGMPSDVDSLNAELRAKKAVLDQTSRLNLMERRDLNKRIKILEGREATFTADREINPFKYYMIDAMSPENFIMIFGKDKSTATLEEINKISGETGRDLQMEARDLRDAEGRTILQVASNGFYLRMSGTNEGHEIYEIVKADGTVWTPEKEPEKEMDLQTAQDLFIREAQGYLDEEIVSFDKEHKKDTIN